jgi:hypothetical protein
MATTLATIYKAASPYAKTPTWGQFLDVWTSITIPADITDALYQIDPPYRERPDLLAYDLYQDSNLWWVFAVRNPDVIQDPIYDFVPPNIIYIPSKAVLFKALGL